MTSKNTERQIEVHAPIRVAERTYLTELAVNPLLSNSKTVAEVFSRGVVDFLQRKPFTEFGFNWSYPQSYYFYQDGKRYQRAEWVAWHAFFIDVEFGEKGTIGACLIMERVKKAMLEHHVSMAVFIWSAIQWMTSEAGLFPPSRFRINYSTNATTAGAVQSLHNRASGPSPRG